jgi:dimethylamine/trimethylamine dehydrogenase
MTNPYAILFESVKIGPVTAPNRFYAAPHATGHGWHEPNGSIALRAMKAEGGWGCVINPMTEIAPDADMGNHPLDRIWDNADLPRHAANVAAIKAHGALAGIELAHGGMRARNYHSGLPVPAPSAAHILRPEIPMFARAMDKTDIAAFRASHRAAAQRAKDAGYDILYVYAAHDLSLLSHFLSANTNHRTDEYGGSFENRIRLLRETLEDTLEIAAGECAVALRFSVCEPDKPTGLRHDGEGRDVVEALAELPDLWDVNLAGWPADSQTARFSDEGYQLPFTDFVKSITTKPVVGVGRFTSPDAMVAAIRKGRLDLIGAARPSIADPFLPTKIRENRIADIRECIGCNICVSMDSYGVPLRCTQNPTIAEEFRRNWHPEIVPISKSRKSYLIVGAGPAGLECALTLLRAGNHVTLADASDQPGGRITREASLPGLSTWARVRDYRTYQLAQSANANLYLSSPMSVDDLKDFGADHIVIATGAQWLTQTTVPEAKMLFVQSVNRAFLSPDDIMYGAQLSGTVTVYDEDHFYMASLLVEKIADQSVQVTYATPLATVSSWTDHTLEQDRIIARLQSLGVALLVNTKIDGPNLRNTLTGETKPLGATVVHVGPRRSQDNLFIQAQQLLGAENVTLCGDALVPGTIQAAVHSGHRIARHLLGDPRAGAAFNREVPILF